MASVRIDFVKPNDPDLVALHIWEASEKEGVYNEIEEVDEIGTFPNYISYYTTDQAASTIGWFRIQWEDSKGATSELSEPRQGGADNLVSIIVDRVLLRDSSINEAVAVQEAEAVIQWYFGGKDPYSIDPATVSYTQMSGLTLLTLGRSLLFEVLVGGSSSANSWTAGLVSLKSESGTGGSSTAGIFDLLKQANTLLGLSQSSIAQMEEITLAGGASVIVSRDQSRLLVEIE